MSQIQAQIYSVIGIDMTGFTGIEFGSLKTQLVACDSQLANRNVGQAFCNQLWHQKASREKLPVFSVNLRVLCVSVVAVSVRQIQPPRHSEHGGCTEVHQATRVKQSMDRRIEKIVSYIESDFGKKIRLDELSHSINLSPWRLCHLFKQEMGVSVVHFLHAVRLREARKLLEGTCLTIKEIRTRVGFPDESNFIKAFEKSCLVSPSEYRIQHWNIHSELISK